MTATRNHADDRLELLDGLIYADVFGCALTLEELWCWSRISIDRDDLKHRLAEDPVLRSVASEQDGHWSLSDRAEPLVEGAARARRAQRLQRRARLVARCVRHVPFVRGLMLTGSLAAGDAGDTADLDVLVVVAPGRLGIVFMLLAPVARLTRRRLLCPNYYIAEDRLALGAGSVYLAREVAQARPLLGDPCALRDANRWVDDVFPNARDQVATPGTRLAASRIQPMLEAPWRGSAGDRLERRALRLAHARLTVHHRRFGETPPTDVAQLLETGSSLRFHGGAVQDNILGRYTQRRNELAARLMAIDSGPAQSEMGSAANA